MIYIDHRKYEIFDYMDGEKLTIMSPGTNWVGGNTDHYIDTFYNNIKYYELIYGEVIHIYNSFIFT